MSHALEAREQRGEQQPLLRLPHVFLGPSLREALLDEEREPALLHLLAGRGDQPAGHIFQHHRVQGEAAGPLPPLDERAPTQAIHGSSSSWVMLPKTTVPPERNGSIWPPKR